MLGVGCRFAVGLVMFIQGFDFVVCGFLGVSVVV